MSQEYTPVDWVDETPNTPGTLINKARLDQMQTAHHYADGFEEVDAVPTEDPQVDYHKVVYCTADSTFYRWDGAQWTKDIDDDTKALLLAHEADHNNPHVVTKAQVGLGNVDNTSDADKPVSDATASAIGLVQGYLDAHEANTSNPHSVTKTQVGLGNADNTSDLDKPISTATQTALDAKLDANASITGATKCKITYDGKGLVTGGADLAESDIPALTISKIMGLQTALDGKADDATTLAGYGITDAYDKSQVDTLLATKQDTLTFDTAPTASSTNPVTSGGVYTALTNGTVTKIGTVNVGNDTKPIKLIAGVPTEVTNDFVDLPSAQAITGAKTVPLEATGTFSDQIASSNKVKNELDNYAPMVRTTGNQNVNGVKNYQYAPKNDYGGSQGTGAGWFKLWESETSIASIRRTTILKILLRDTGNYGVFSIVRRALSQSYAGMLYGNIPTGSVKISRDSNGKMTLWTNTTRTSAWIEVETSATAVSEADYSTVLNDNTAYTEPQAADYSWMWTL